MSEDEPAGPDRVQRFNAVRILIGSVVVIVASTVYLVGALRGGGSPVLPSVLLGVGVLGAGVGIWMVRRHWVKRDGLTLDEADPRRTPEQQQRRDDRVRKNNADMSPGQEIGVGLAVIPFAAVLGAVPLLFGDSFNWFLSIALAVLGVVLLVRGLVRQGRRN